MLDLLRHAVTSDPLTAALLFSYSDMVVAAIVIAVMLGNCWIFVLLDKPRRVRFTGSTLVVIGCAIILCAMNVYHATGQASSLRRIVATQDYEIGFSGMRFSVYLHEPDSVLLGKPVRGYPLSSNVSVPRERMDAVANALQATGLLQPTECVAHACSPAGNTASRLNGIASTPGDLTAPGVAGRATKE